MLRRLLELIWVYTPRFMTLTVWLDTVEDDPTAPRYRGWFQIKCFNLFGHPIWIRLEELEKVSVDKE